MKLTVGLGRLTRRIWNKLTPYIKVFIRYGRPQLRQHVVRNAARPRKQGAQQACARTTASLGDGKCLAHLLPFTSYPHAQRLRGNFFRLHPYSRTAGCNTRHRLAKSVDPFHSRYSGSQTGNWSGGVGEGRSQCNASLT